MKVSPSLSEINEAFPEMDFGIKPTGSRVLVQIRRPKSKIGSIILSDYTKDAEQDNTQVAKVIATGPLSFRNRNTMEPESHSQCSRAACMAHFRHRRKYCIFTVNVIH